MRQVGWIVGLFLVVMVGPTLLAQGVVEGAQAIGAVAPGASTSEWGSAVVWAFLSSSALEWLKRNQRVTVVSDRMAWGVQRVIGIGLAIATAAGIQASFEPTAGVLTISGLLWPSVSSAAGESLRQWVFQELTYRTAIKDFGQRRADS